MLSTGSMLGPYRIEAALGKGGMGEVYRAHDTRLGRDVAIKILPEYLFSKSALQRFQREAKVLAALSNPNIVTIYDVGTDNNISYVVMELLEGHNLRQVMRGETLSLNRALKLAIAIVEGLAAAHSKGIIHRDLKPENIFLTTDGRVKVLDFGLAKHESPLEERSQAPTATEPLTKPQSVPGTLPYMSPEQLQGANVDARTDLFSFGSVLYEMVSGRRAFAGESSTELVASILRDDPAKLEQNIPSDVERVILHCLEKSPDKRFQNSRDLCFALQAIQDKPAVQLQTSRFSRRFAFYSVAIAALILIGIFLFKATLLRDKGIESVAVLPFENLIKDPEMEYLGDGITESLINKLSQFPKLKVIAQSSVLRYKGRGVDPRKAGKELKVQTVLMGKVQQRGEDVFISAELVDVGSNAHLWGDQYSRRIVDVLFVQEEISRQIAERLKHRVSGDAEIVSKRPTENSEAYQLYLKGRFHSGKRTAEHSEKAIVYYRGAIQKDPAYAAPYAGLSDAYRIMGETEKAREMAIKALELDKDLPEALVALARIKLNTDWDIRAAEEACKRALSANSNFAEAYHMYSHVLMAAGRAQESLAQSSIALELAPVDLSILHHHAWCHYQLTNHSETINLSSKILEMDPEEYYSHLYCGLAFVQQKNYQKGLSHLQKAISISVGPDAYVALGYTYAIAGDRQKALNIIKDQKDRLDSCQIGIIYAGLGEYDQAFDRLKKGVSEHCLDIIYWKTDPYFNPLRNDPRFQPLVQKIGF